MEPLIHKIRFSIDDMGYAEKKIANYLIEHTGEIVDISISELSERCDCGVATIVRFARRFGLDGYQELKLQLASEINSTSYVNTELNQGDNCLDIFRKRCNSVMETFKQTEDVLDINALNIASTVIKNAGRIVLFALGNSASVSQDTAHKFLRIGLPAQACSDGYMMRIIASHLNSGDVAIGISHSGCSKDIIEALRLAKTCEATTICVTNFGHSPIVDFSDIPIFTKSSETDIHPAFAFSSRYAQLMIFDTIYSNILLKYPEESEQAIYNTEFSLNPAKFQ